MNRKMKNKLLEVSNKMVIAGIELLKDGKELKRLLEQVK